MPSLRNLLTQPSVFDQSLQFFYKAFRVATRGDKGGFLAGQVFKFSGFVSDQGSLNATRTADEHYVIVTYWRSFEEHERSHADATFTNKFEALAKMCSGSKELGYEMLWQGAPEQGGSCRPK